MFAKLNRAIIGIISKESRMKKSDKYQDKVPQKSDKYQDKVPQKSDKYQDKVSQKFCILRIFKASTFKMVHID